MLFSQLLVFVNVAGKQSSNIYPGNRRENNWGNKESYFGSKSSVAQQKNASA